jgi:hypothetical protein
MALPKMVKYAKSTALADTQVTVIFGSSQFYMMFLFLGKWEY